MMSKTRLSLLVASAAFLALPTLVNAGERDAPGPVIGYVTYSDASLAAPIEAPVRIGARGGREVLVPNWGWTDCQYSCSGALESHYGSNFWETQNAQGAVKSNILNNLLGLR